MNRPLGASSNPFAGGSATPSSNIHRRTNSNVVQAAARQEPEVQLTRSLSNKSREQPSITLSTTFSSSSHSSSSYPVSGTRMSFIGRATHSVFPVISSRKGMHRAHMKVMSQSATDLFPVFPVTESTVMGCTTPYEHARARRLLTQPRPPARPQERLWRINIYYARSREPGLSPHPGPWDCHSLVSTFPILGITRN